MRCSSLACRLIFLVELSDSIFAKVKSDHLPKIKITYSSFVKLDLLLQREAGLSFATSSHQAVDFILGKVQLCYLAANETDQ
jgi:hypothetical protein